MADMNGFRCDYKGGEFTHYGYRFHACQAHMYSRKIYGQPTVARFYSYSTPMAGIVANGKVYLRKDFDSFSRTTTRQVTRFLEDLTGMRISVHELRKAREDGDELYGIVFVDGGFIYDNF